MIKQKVLVTLMVLLFTLGLANVAQAVDEAYYRSVVESFIAPDF